LRGFRGIEAAIAKSNAGKNNYGPAIGFVVMAMAFVFKISVVAHSIRPSSQEVY
jgi:hypothetical protein